MSLTELKKDIAFIIPLYALERCAFLIIFTYKILLKSFLLYQKRKERETMKIDKTVIIDEIETAKSQIIDILSEDQEREESTAERIINIIDNLLNNLESRNPHK